MIISNILSIFFRFQHITFRFTPFFRSNIEGSPLQIKLQTRALAKMSKISSKLLNTFAKYFYLKFHCNMFDDKTIIRPSRNIQIYPKRIVTGRLFVLQIRNHFVLAENCNATVRCIILCRGKNTIWWNYWDNI